MTRSRWGEGLEGISERIPGYRVVLTNRTRRGVRKLHTFVVDADTEDEPGGPYWGRAVETLRPEGLDGVLTVAEQLPEVVSLARSVDVPAPLLMVILDVCASAGRHSIDLADVNTIVSQWGSRLRALDTLAADQRAIATPALFSTIRDAVL